MTSETPQADPHETDRVLVLQGGGALGSYQAGVVEALQEADMTPGWVAGISIGAINAALIAATRPSGGSNGCARTFWERISSGCRSAAVSRRAGPGRLQRVERRLGRDLRVPGFFLPRVPPALFYPPAPPRR